MGKSCCEENVRYMGDVSEQAELRECSQVNEGEELKGQPTALGGEFVC